MLNQSKKPSGVLHWNAKKIALRAALGAMDDKQAIANVLYMRFKESPDAETVDKYKKTYDSWSMRTPTKSSGPKRLFEYIVDVLELSCQPTQLIVADIIEFLSFFNIDDRKAAMKLLKSSDDHDLSLQELKRLEKNCAPSFTTDPGSPDGESDGDSARIFKLHFPVSEHTPSVKIGVEAGHISQCHYYLSHDSANSWIDLIASEDYPSYQHCEEGIRAMVSSPPWRSLLEQHNYDLAVLLGGGGSPTKDVLLLKSFIQEQCSPDALLAYTLLDISPHLLFTSQRFLDRELARLKLDGKVEIRTICANFLDLDDCTELLRGSHNVVWAITGGTIGNVQEREFFRSLNTKASTNDLLMISMDTYSASESLSDFSEKILGKYEHEAMQNFLSVPLNEVLKVSKTGENVGEALKRVEVNVGDGVDSVHTDVPGSRYVEWSIDIDGNKIVLLNSTRYAAEQFKDFAGDQGWRFVCSSQSKTNPEFQQLLFIKK